MPDLDAALSLETAFRRRLAADLHDDPLQALAAVAMGLELLRMQRGEDAELAEIEEVARDATRRLRRMLADVHGPENDIPLAEALEAHVADVGASCRIELEDEPPESLRVLVGRLAAEAAAGGAESVRVWSRDGGVVVRIEGARESDAELAEVRTRLAGGRLHADGSALEVDLPA